MRLSVIIVTVALAWLPYAAVANDNYAETHAFDYVELKLRFLFLCQNYLGRQTLLDEEKKAPSELRRAPFTDAEVAEFRDLAIRWERVADNRDIRPTAANCADRWSDYQKHESDWFVGIGDWIE